MLCVDLILVRIKRGKTDMNSLCTEDVSKINIVISLLLSEKQALSVFRVQTMKMLLFEIYDISDLVLTKSMWQT